LWKRFVNNNVGLFENLIFDKAKRYLFFPICTWEGKNKMTPKTRNIDLVCSGICLAENVAIVLAQRNIHFQIPITLYEWIWVVFWMKNVCSFECSMCVVYLSSIQSIKNYNLLILSAILEFLHLLWNQIWSCNPGKMIISVCHLSNWFSWKKLASACNT
jgi:hypothetical protein